LRRSLEAQDCGESFVGLWDRPGALGLAKIFELSDGPIYHAIGIISGHTLKHVTAAAAVACVVAMPSLRSEVTLRLCGATRNSSSGRSELADLARALDVLLSGAG
jgi:hypothetical protein